MSGSRGEASRPIVSVLMTAFNRSNFVAQSIASVLESTFHDFELIIVDNCSTDDTVAIARGYEKADDRVRVFQNESNVGDFPNRNRAAEHARGTYLKYVDSDDLIYPHGLDVMVRCMRDFPEAGLGLSAVPDIAGPCPRALTPVEAYREHFFRSDLLSRAPGSTIIQRTAFQAVGGFSGQRYIGDPELWLKIARRYDVVKMPMDLLWDRQHPGQEQRTQDKVDWAVMREDVEIAALHADDCPLDDAERSAASTNLSARRARNYWQFLVGRGGIRLANRYRKRASLPATAIAGFAFSRLRRRASAQDRQT